MLWTRIKPIEIASGGSCFAEYIVRRKVMYPQAGVARIKLTTAYAALLGDADRSIRVGVFAYINILVLLYPIRSNA